MVRHGALLVRLQSCFLNAPTNQVPSDETMSQEPRRWCQAGSGFARQCPAAVVSNRHARNLRGASRGGAGGFPPEDCGNDEVEVVSELSGKAARSLYQPISPAVHAASLLYGHPPCTESAGLETAPAKSSRAASPVCARCTATTYRTPRQGEDWRAKPIRTKGRWWSCPPEDGKRESKRTRFENTIVRRRKWPM